MRLEGMQRVGQALDRAFGCWAELLTNHVGVARLDVLDADDDGSPIVAAATKRGFSFLALDRAFIDPLFCRVPCRRVWIFAVATRALALSYVVRATLRVGANVGAGPAVVAAGSAVVAVKPTRRPIITAEPAVVAVKPARRPIITAGPAVVAAGPPVIAARPTVVAVKPAWRPIIAARSAVVAVKPAWRPIIAAIMAIMAMRSSVVAAWPTSIAAGSIAARSAIKSGFFVAGHGTLTLPPGTDRGVRCPDQN